MVYMASRDPVKPEGKRQTQKHQAKKPYTKPAFRFERVFETQALSCGKISVTQGACRFNRHSS